MKNTSMIILLVCTFASTSHALSFLQKLHITHHSGRAVNSRTHSSLHTEDVAHFTHHWKGVCISENGDSTPLSVSIENSAEKIKLDNEEFEIGTFLTFSEATSDHTRFSHNAFNWSDDGQQLLIDYADIGQSSQSGIFYTDTGHITLSLESERLVMKISASDNYSDENPVSIVCTFNQE